MDAFRAIVERSAGVYQCWGANGTPNPRSFARTTAVPVHGKKWIALKKAPGALVLAGGGICGVDEMDEMERWG